MIKECPLKIAIVGDLPKARALELAAHYLGALPFRPRIGPETFRAIRTLKRPAGPRTFEAEIETPTKQAFVMSGFIGQAARRRAA